MDRLDALGPRPDRHAAFSRDVLAETEDHELTAIVDQAASELGAPIALVSLILEHIQFFKAHVGLPPDLAASRATERAVSFCQFVVRDGKPFEVSDAASDERVPKQLVEQYAIRSYLGYPVVVDDTVVGSLCVIDTEPRAFTERDRAMLGRLARLVDARLGELSRARRTWDRSIVQSTAEPALGELRRALAPIQNSAAGGLVALSAVSSALRLVRHVQSGGSTPPEMMAGSLDAAERAVEDAVEAFLNIQASAGDVDDTAKALQGVLAAPVPVRLSDLAIAGRELARSAVAAAGGVTLPEIEHDARVLTPRPLGVALVATCLSLLAAEVAGKSGGAGLRMAVGHRPGRAELVIAAPIPAAAAAAACDQLVHSAGPDPTVAVSVEGSAIRLSFLAAEPAPERVDEGETAAGG